jgi:hypothetical protein
MRALFIALMMTVGMNAHSQAIYCGDGSCSYDPDLDIRNDENFSSFSQFDVFNLENTLQITTPSDQAPRNVKLSVSNVEGSINDILINLRSSKKGFAGGSAIVLSPKNKNMSIDVSGRKGNDALNASYVCANKVLNGEFGEAIKSRFLTMRINDPSLPSDQCTQADLLSVQGNQFSCGEGFSEFDGINILANRWTPRRECTSQSQRNLCVQRRMKITCTWLAEKIPGRSSCEPTNSNGDDGFNPRPRGGGAGGKNWICDPAVASDFASGWKIVFDPVYKDEAWVQSRRLAGMTDEDVCDEITQRFGDYMQGFSDVVGNYYENINSVKTTLGVNSEVDNKTRLTVTRGAWLGNFNSQAQASNPRRVINMPSSGYVVGVETSPCRAAGVSNEAQYVQRILTDPCRRPGTLAVSVKEQDNLYRSDGHTYKTWESVEYWKTMCTNNARGHECANCKFNGSYSGTYMDCLSTVRYRARQVVGNIGTSTGSYYDFNVSQFIGAVAGDQIKILNTGINYRYEKGSWKSSCCWKTKRKWSASTRTISEPRFYVYKSAYADYPVGSYRVPVDFRTNKQPFSRADNLNKSTEIPTEISCFVQNDRNIDCTNTIQGIRFGVAYDLKVKWYAPNGRLMDYYIRWGVARM